MYSIHRRHLPLCHVTRKVQNCSRHAICGTVAKSLTDSEGTIMNSVNHIDELGLRRRAEAKLAQAELPSKLPLRDPVRVLHELQVHQIELEMQNEELLE